MTKDGPKVLEYNVRFGDPECEPLLMRLESDLLEIMDACIDGRLDEVKLSIRPESALGVVIAAEGYPGSYPKGMEIKGIDAVDALPDTKVFQAGTKREGSRTLSSGGRVLCVTALGKGLAEAQKRAYEAVAKIDMEKSQRPKLLADIPAVDVVITMGCGVTCPNLPCKRREDWGLEDPTGKPDEAFIAVIRAIEARVLALRAELARP